MSGARQLEHEAPARGAPHSAQNFPVDAAPQDGQAIGVVIAVKSTTADTPTGSPRVLSARLRDPLDRFLGLAVVVRFAHHVGLGHDSHE